MLATLLALLHGVVDLFSSRRDLAVENLDLRQQLAIYKRTVARRVAPGSRLPGAPTDPDVPDSASGSSDYGFAA